jgi:hypothetical protein
MNCRGSDGFSLSTPISRSSNILSKECICCNDTSHVVAASHCQQEHTQLWLRTALNGLAHQILLVLEHQLAIRHSFQFVYVPGLDCCHEEVSGQLF